MNRSRLLNLAALAGILGPLLLAVVITVLTIVQADFMRTLGWNPTGPVIDWPSGLAMGPHGWLMTLTFFVCGALMTFFAYGLKLALPRRWNQADSAGVACGHIADRSAFSPQVSSSSVASRTRSSHNGAHG